MKGGNGSVRIKHSERIKNIYSSVDFETTSCTLQPGIVDGACFEWLSALASRFETYKFHSLSFQYRSKTSTGSVGNVIISVDYDALNPPPEDGVAAEAYRTAMSSAPWSSFTLACKAADLGRRSPKYIRTGDVADADLKTYDTGKVHFSVEGSPTDGVLLGMVYVQYDIEFYTPILKRVSAPAPPVSSVGQINIGLLTGSTTANWPNDTNTLAAYVSSFKSDASSTLLFNPVPATGFNIRFVAGSVPANSTYLLTMSMWASDAINNSVRLGVLVQATSVNNETADASSIQAMAFRSELGVNPYAISIQAVINPSLAFSDDVSYFSVVPLTIGSSYAQQSASSISGFTVPYSHVGVLTLREL
jgi:hypothetical protein